MLSSWWPTYNLHCISPTSIWPKWPRLTTGDRVPVIGSPSAGLPMCSRRRRSQTLISYSDITYITKTVGKSKTFVDLSGLKHRTCASAPDKPSRPGDQNVVSLMIWDWNHKNLKMLLYLKAYAFALSNLHPIWGTINSFISQNCIFVYRYVYKLFISDDLIFFYFLIDLFRRFLVIIFVSEKSF